MTTCVCNAFESAILAFRTFQTEFCVTVGYPGLDSHKPSDMPVGSFSVVFVDGNVAGPDDQLKLWLTNPRVLKVRF